MASIPLLCNICPKRPDFSDISHLLTHVGSKGHLSHYFKAQVRSRQDATIRQQLEIYDCWYAKHQIEKLLSQRMVLKESKDTRTKPRGIRKSLNSSSVQKNPSKATIAVRESLPASPLENFIDPQLSQTHYSSKETLSQDSPLVTTSERSNKLASEHRTHIPTMQQHPVSYPFPKDLPKKSKKNILSFSEAEDDIDAGNGSDHDCLRTQSPFKSTYPDPIALVDQASISLPGFTLTPRKENTHREQSEKMGSEDNSAVPEVGLTQSPKLKGAHYPGMSLFDSASIEAQRKRNQKKNISIMAQMELNSIEVEPLERIYWPEGNLKKERIITGMVESSPIKEDTPRPKRQRQAAKRIPLDNLNANAPRESGRRRGRKPSSRTEMLQDAELGDLSKHSVALLDFPSLDLATSQCRPRAVHEKEEEIEWRFGAGGPGNGNIHDFIVFNDELEQQPNYSAQQFGSEPQVVRYGSISNLYSNAEKLESKLLPNGNLGYAFDPSEHHPFSHFNFNILPTGDRLHHSSINSSSISMMNKENIEPVLDSQGRIDDTIINLGSEHNTQRYFSPPEFFDYLPTQMELGGLAGSRFSGSSLNPLNANVQRQKTQNIQYHSNHRASAESELRCHTSSSRRANFR